MKLIHPSELGRLIKDSKESTLTVEDELAFIKMVLLCLSTGMSYQESLEVVYVQLSNNINDD